MNIKQFLFILIIALISFTPVNNHATVIDPENEHYFRCFLGFKNNHFVIGLDYHAAFDTNLYADLSITSYPYHIISIQKNLPNYEIITGLQLGSFGYQRYWSNTKIKYKNIVFGETLQM